MKSVKGIGKKIKGINKYISIFWGLKSNMLIWVNPIKQITIKRILIGNFILVFGANKNINNKNNGNNAYKHVIGKKQEIILKYSWKQAFVFTEWLLIIESKTVKVKVIVGKVKRTNPNIAK